MRKVILFLIITLLMIHITNALIKDEYTECDDNGICEYTSTLQFVNDIDGIMKPIIEAKSLSKYFFYSYQEYDNKLSINVTDFNATAIKLCLNVSTYLTPIPFSIYKQYDNGTIDKTYNVSLTFPNKNKLCYNINFATNILDKKIKLGTNSTVLILNGTGANKRLLFDTQVYEGVKTNTYETSATIKVANTTDSTDYYSIFMFNITDLYNIQQYTILNASLFVYETAMSVGAGTVALHFVNSTWANAIDFYQFPCLQNGEFLNDTNCNLTAESSTTFTANTQLGSWDMMGSLNRALRQNQPNVSVALKATYAAGATISTTFYSSEGTVKPYIYILYQDLSYKAQRLNGLFDNITNEGNFTHLKVSNDTILGYWSFDINLTQTSPRVYDYSNYNRDLIVQGITPQEDGPYGKAIILNGTNKASASATIVQDQQAGNYTIAAWFKAGKGNSTSTCQGIFSLASSGFADTTSCSYVGIQMLLNSTGSLCTGYYTGSAVTYCAGNDLRNSWHFGAIVKNQTNDLNVYVDGNLVGYKTGVTYNSYALDTISIGSIAGNGYWNYFNGSIDEVMFINATLSLDQIKTIYNNTYPKFYSKGNRKLGLNPIIQEGFNQLNISFNAQQFQNTSFNVSAYWWNSTNNMSYNNTNENLIALLHFEDDTVDSSGRVIARNQSAREAQGYFGTGMKFRGQASTTDAVVIGKNSATDSLGLTNGTNFTINMWAKIDSCACGGAGECVLAGKSVAATAIWAFGIQESTCRMYTQYGTVNNTLNNDANYLQPRGVWQMYTAVFFSGRNLSIYRNGTYQNGYAFSMPLNGTGAEITIGALNRSGVYWWDGINGTIDEVSIWNRSLTPKEILSLYHTNTLNGIGTTGSNWTFSGSKNYDSQGMVFNISNTSTYIYSDINYVSNQYNSYSPEIIGNISFKVYPYVAPTINYPTVTLNAPPQNNKTTNGTIYFNCTATDGWGVYNISFYLTNSSNQSFTLNDTNVSMPINTFNHTLNLSVGNYTWNCYSCNINNYCSWGTNNTIWVDWYVSTAATCDCPSSGNWIISDGSTCYLSTTCNIYPNKLLINNGTLRINAGGYLKAGGCYVDRLSGLYTDDQAGRYCGG